eukprot:1499082-Prymnesium_polylepis.3
MANARQVRKPRRLHAVTSGDVGVVRANTCAWRRRTRDQCEEQDEIERVKVWPRNLCARRGGEVWTHALCAQRKSVRLPSLTCERVARRRAVYRLLQLVDDLRRVAAEL